MTPRRNTPRKVKGSSPKNKVKKILARWSDGLFYIIKILKVSEMTKRCLVEFEDHSTAYVHFKDLLEENQDDALMCHNCGGQEEFENNTFLQCTNCERQYHRFCHVPPITTEAMAKHFICRICVFAACAKPGGAKDSGPMASKFLFMKQEFPYDLEHLSWNPSHTQNVSECYCYCGGPGSWYNKMLQCCRCSQWFHEACVQCLDAEVLMGDRFYVFACAHCNFGEEFITRVDMKWYNIVYVAIFHLSMAQGLKYTDIDAHIVPFLKQKANSFGLQRLLNGRHLDKKAIRQEVLNIVMSLTDIFCCGSEVKKKCTLFGLRERIPPAPPSVFIPFHGEKLTPASLNNALGKRVNFKPAKYTMPVPYLIKGANKFIPSSIKVREAKVARLKNEHNYCSFSHEHRASTSSDSSSEGYDSNNNSSPVKPSSPDGREECSDTESVDMDDVDGSFSFNDSVMSACQISPVSKSSMEDTHSNQSDSDKHFWSLDTAFPEPANFDGVNNPFLTDYEVEDLLTQRQYFITHLDQLAEKCGNNFPAQSRFSFPQLSLNAVPSSLRDLRGFKGELAMLVNRNDSAVENCSSPKTQLRRVSEKRSSGSSSSPLPSRFRRSRRRDTPSASPVSSVRTSSSSPKSRQQFMNGLKHCIKIEPEEEEMDENEQKKLRNLSRCLKNLTPTCGFRFPVLAENHPSMDDGQFGQEENQPVSPCLLKPLNKKGRKRKHSSAPTVKSTSCTSDSDNVRRSYRNRTTVKRFEIDPQESHQEYREHHATSSVLSSVKYNVISLRVCHDNTVDYLVDWCN